MTALISSSIGVGGLINEATAIAFVGDELLEDASILDTFEPFGGAGLPLRICLQKQEINPKFSEVVSLKQ